MRFGNMPKSGDVVLATVQFTDSFEVKKRPALVLFEDFGNVVVAGITSNTKMKGIVLTKEDGAVKDSVIKINYIFTVSEGMIERTLFHLKKAKKLEVFDALSKHLEGLRV
jgi:mRNA interferase MazF